ncbi:hypothetical protein [Microbacterium sp. 77mftsu3.1]|uniref:hypothetical protein n=1 Tax=Microbacterium sp. 77mftsu3.1 TaxID=1761802 RepID=UPI00037D58E2|nr:hypothetical protein [Microbacterium sp. 77mftsu3.1]SDH41819.1 hypothetical protein SAMN04488590_3290 [Microbacterium sp. 77mftsu3.1]
MDYYAAGQLVDTALATDHALRVEIDNGEVTAEGQDLAEEWDVLEPGQGFTVLAWVGHDGIERPVGEPTATALRMMADTLDYHRYDERLAAIGHQRAYLRDPLA